MTENRSSAYFNLRRLSTPDAGIYRNLRLEALRTNPEAFGASWEEEAAQPLTWFADRLARNVIFGGHLATSPQLQGIIGLHTPDTPKQRHKGVLWGMFVHPDARGTGLARSLLTRILDHARRSLEELRLTVVATNTAAIRLYEHAGFNQYGLDPRALKTGHNYHDELLMALSLPRHETPSPAGGRGSG